MAPKPIQRKHLGGSSPEPTQPLKRIDKTDEQLIHDLIKRRLEAKTPQMLADALTNTEATNQQMREAATLSPAAAAKMDEIVIDAGKIDPAKVAVEVLQWLTDHIEDYIDNAETIYRIYFRPEAISELSEAGKLQALYHAIPDTGHEKEVECIDALHNVTAKVKEAMDTDELRLAALFQRLVSFYDMKVGRDAVGNPMPIITPMDGSITLHEFIFDTFSQTTKTTQKFVQMTREEMQAPDAVERVKSKRDAGQYQEVVTETEQPEGFALEMEISYWPRLET